MSSPWIFLISLATVILSEFSLYWTHKFPSVDQLVPIEYNAWPDSCGRFAPPLIYCMEQHDYSVLRYPLVFFWQVLNPFSLIVLGLVLICWIKPYITHPNVLALLGLSDTAAHIKNPKWTKWMKRLLSLLTIVVESLFLIAALCDAVCFAFFDVEKLIDWSNWSFGQIVAITLWLPVASKYFYWNICKSPVFHGLYNMHSFIGIDWFI